MLSTYTQTEDNDVVTEGKCRHRNSVTPKSNTLRLKWSISNVITSKPKKETGELLYVYADSRTQ